MAGVKAGGNRQELHERIRKHSRAAAARVKQLGESNDLIERLNNDAAFSDINVKAVLDPRKYVGLAPQQVDHFIKEQVTPVRRKYRKDLGKPADLKV